MVLGKFKIGQRGIYLPGQYRIWSDWMERNNSRKTVVKVDNPTDATFSCYDAGTGQFLGNAEPTFDYALQPVHPETIETIKHLRKKYPDDISRYIEYSLKGNGQPARELPPEHECYTRAEVEKIVREVIFRYNAELANVSMMIEETLRRR